MKKQDERRLIENEAIFKQINEDVNGFLHDVELQHNGPARFFCECSDLGCKQRISLPAAEYKKIHKKPTHFTIISGHENLELEKVIKRRKGYSIVEKFRVPPPGSEVEHRMKEL